MAPMLNHTGELKAGFNDAVPHQLVRTSSDRLYTFVARGNGSSLLDAYWTTSPGIPTDGSAFAGVAEVDTSGAIISVDSAYDGSSVGMIGFQGWCWIMNRAKQRRDNGTTTTNWLFQVEVWFPQGIQ